MNVSERGLAFNAQREALVLTAHKDTANLAIGFGLNKPGLKEGDTITIEEAVALYLEHAKHYEADVDRVFAGIPLTQQAYDCFFSLAWNCGGTYLRQYTELAVAVGLYFSSPTDRILRDKAAKLITEAKYDPVKGPFNFARRCREALIFINGDYGDLSTLKFWPVGKMPRVDEPELIPMPTFRGTA